MEERAECLIIFSSAYQKQGDGMGSVMNPFPVMYFISQRFRTIPKEHHYPGSKFSDTSAYVGAFLIQTTANGIEVVRHIYGPQGTFHAFQFYGKPYRICNWEACLYFNKEFYKEFAHSLKRYSHSMFT